MTMPLEDQLGVSNPFITTHQNKNFSFQIKFYTIEISPPNHECTWMVVDSIYVNVSCISRQENNFKICKANYRDPEIPYQCNAYQIAEDISQMDIKDMNLKINGSKIHLLKQRSKLQEQQLLQKI